VKLIRPHHILWKERKGVSFEKLMPSLTLRNKNEDVLMSIAGGIGKDG
jgi:hypothetical protein